MLSYSVLVRVHIFFFQSSLLLSRLTPTRYFNRRFYPQQTSRQAVVTSVYPSLPPITCLFFVAQRVQHSHCSSIFIECSLLTFSRFPRINFLMQEKAPTSKHSVRLEPTKLILIGTRATYQATGDAGMYDTRYQVPGIIHTWYSLPLFSIPLQNDYSLLFTRQDNSCHTSHLVDLAVLPKVFRLS